MKKNYDYEPIEEELIPQGIRFTAPERLRGQIVQVEYGHFGADEGCSGDPFMRIRDTSDGPDWSYFRRVPKQKEG